VDISNGSYEQLGNFSSTNIISFGEDKQGELYILKQGVSSLYKVVTKKTFEETLPQALSLTGAFTNLGNLTPSEGIIPYKLVEPFWSDGALKKRWIGIPNDGTHDTPEEQIKYSENDNWELPIGSVLIKHFEMPIDENDISVTKRLETRFSVKAADGNFYFVTYKWNDAQTDAILLTSGLDETLNITMLDGSIESQVWTYPGRSDCITCHNESTGGTIGIRTRYLNENITYPETTKTANQLVTLSHLGILDEVITDADTESLLTYKSLNDSNASLDEKARSYLDLNCAYCHQSGSGVRADFDLRMTLNLEETGLLNAGIYNSLNVPNEKILAEGDPERSILYLRAKSIETGIAMPAIAKNKIDQEGVDLLKLWIEQLGNEPVISVYHVVAAPAEVNLEVGETFQMTANPEPANATNKGVTWFSNNNEIATITNGGLVTAVGSGTVDVTVTTDDGGYKASATINVTGGLEPPVAVYNVVVSPLEVNLVAGETFQLTSTVEPPNATDQSVSWISNNPEIASIDENGLVTAIGTGLIDVTVSSNDGGYSASSLINVTGGVPPTVSVYNVTTSPSEITMGVGETFVLNASVEPANATNQNVTWFSNDPSIVSINEETGFITANASGVIDVTVVAEDGGYQATVIVNVESPEQNSVNIYPMPAVGSVNVDLGKYEGQMVILKLYNQNNQLLETKQYDENHAEVIELMLDTYPSGYYYLLIQTATNYETKPIILN
jgi:uncharacterized repeat protein (TIGR03806 family)